MEALITTPDKRYISLDVINNAGQCRLPLELTFTRMARVMLDRDVDMKRDYLLPIMNGNNTNNSGLTALWVSLMQANPLYGQFLLMGFQRYPYVQIRANIEGDTVKVTQDNNRIEITEANLGLDYSVEQVGIDRTGLTLTPAQNAALDAMLVQFQQQVQYRMDTAAVSFIQLINTSPKYADLRAVYTAIACAELYKSLNIPNNPYSSIINTNDFSVYGYSIPFPRGHYDSLAYQYLATEHLNAYYGGQVTRDIFGGVTLVDLHRLETLGFSSAQNNKFSAALDSVYYQGTTAYVNAGGPGGYFPQLYVGRISVEPQDTTAQELAENEMAVIKIHIMNTGNVDAHQVVVRVYDEFMDANQVQQSYVIGVYVIDSVAFFNKRELLIPYQVFGVGAHSFRVEVDPFQLISEIRENDNVRKFKRVVYSKYPGGLFISPQTDYLMPDSAAHFYYVASDAKEGIPATVKMISDVDGVIMNQHDSLHYVVPTLSLGWHRIILQTINNRGFVAEDTIRIYVASGTKPTVRIASLQDGQFVHQNAVASLSADIFDFQDTALCATGKWYVNGTLVAQGCDTSYAFGSVGLKTLVFEATNSRGHIGRDTIQVNVMLITGPISHDTLFSGGAVKPRVSAVSGGFTNTVYLPIDTNRLVIDATLDILGDYERTYPGLPVVTGNKVLYTSGLVAPSANNPTLNNVRAGYKFVKATTGLPNTNPVTERAAFKYTDNVSLACYITNTTANAVSIDRKIELEHPDGVIQVFNYPFTLPAGQSGSTYLITTTFSSGGSFSSKQLGRCTVRFYTKLQSSTTYNLEQTIYFDRQYRFKNNAFSGTVPLNTSYALCEQVQSAYPHQAQNIKSVFSTTDAKATARVAIENISDSLKVFFHWYEPNGDLYKSDTVRIVPGSITANDYRPWTVAASHINISGTLAGMTPGNWRLVVMLQFKLNMFGGFNLGLGVLSDTFEIQGAGQISYPSQLGIKVGNSPVFSYAGAYQDSTVVHIASQINDYVADYLDQHPAAGNPVLVPVEITSATAGRIDLRTDVSHIAGDKQAPVAALISTTPTVVYSGQTYSFRSTITDNDTVLWAKAWLGGTEYAMTRVGSSSTFSSPTLTAGLSGDWPVTLQAIDRFGNLAERQDTLHFLNPLGSVSLALAVSPSTWTTDSVFQLSWTGGTAAITQYFYKVEGVQPYTNHGLVTAKTWTQTIDGQFAVSVYGEDAIGNRTPAATATLRMDRTAPSVVSLQNLTPGVGWTTLPTQMLRWSSSEDAGSGISHYELSINGGSPIPLGDTLALDTTIAQSGIYSFQVGAFDHIGLASAWSNAWTVPLDLTPPTTPVVASPTHPNTSTWYSMNAPRFLFSTADIHSGWAEYRYLFTQSATSTPDATSPILEADSLQIATLPVFSNSQSVPDGIWYMHILAVDQVGNQSAVAHYSVKIDATAPQTTLQAPHADTIDACSYTIALAPVDYSSGISATKYKIDAGSWITGSSILVQGMGSHIVQYYSIDQAGNIETTHADTIYLTGKNVGMTAQLVSPNVIICPGASTTLSGTVTTTGNWTLGLSNGLTVSGSGNSPFSLSVSPSATIAYSITSLGNTTCFAANSGLSGNTTVSINPVIPGSPAVTNVLCNGATTGVIAMNASGGTGSLQYKLGTGAFQTGNTFSSLAAGSYTVTVKDANNCSTSVPVTITQPAALVPGIPAVTQVLCNGAATGAIAMNASGGTGSLQYKLGTGAFQAGNTFSSLAAGNYTITVKDANNCSTSVPVAITQPAALVPGTPAVTQVLCNGATTGAIAMNASGGTGSLQYQLDAGAFQAGNTFSNLAAEIYTITVMDSNNCTTSVPVSITEPAALFWGTPVISHVLCNGDSTGTISVSATGGTGSLRYQLANGILQSSGLFPGLVAGSYSVIISDFNNCTDTLLALQVNQPSALLASALVSGSPLCHGDSTGSVSLTVTGGVAPYTHSWNTGQTSANLQNLPAGSYFSTVTDSNGCVIASNVVVISEPAALSSITTLSPVLCYGDSTGSIALMASGGTPPYSYAWSNGDTAQTALGLPAGTYACTVTDAFGCILADSLLGVSQPAAALSSSVAQVTPASCPDKPDGAIDLSISGGTPPYTLLWSNGASIEDPVGLQPGSYTYTLTDANGCVPPPATGILVTSQNTAPTAGFAAIKGATPGQVQFSDSSVAALGYAWDFGDSNTATTANPTHTYTANGLYSVTLIVSNTCGSDTFVRQVVIMNVSVEEQLPFEVSLSPNPAQDAFTLSFGQISLHHVIISVYDMNGKVLHQLSAELIPAYGKQLVHLNNPAQGVYRVIVHCDEGIDLKTLVIE